MSPVTSDPLSERYGAPSRSRRRGTVLLAGLVGLVALAWLAWAAWSAAHPDVQSKLLTFTVDDAHQSSARVLVKLDTADVRATCLLRATAEDHSVVGEKSFVVTGRRGTTTHELALRTEREATTVELVGCTTPDQQRPR